VDVNVVCAGERMMHGEDDAPDAADERADEGADADVGTMPVEPVSSLSGLTVAGLGSRADEIHGVTLGLLGHQAALLHGLAVGAFNHVAEVQRGVSIGLVNSAERMEGFSFQLGVINHVPSNPPGLRWLPLFNASFGDEEADS
jgi:hypothetical protein